MNQTIASAVLPSGRTILWQQAYLLVRSGKLWLLLAASFGWMVLQLSSRFSDARYELTTRQLSAAQLPFLKDVASELGLLAIAWGLLLWYQEQWGRRDYHLSLPVGHMTHNLFRVVTGGVSLMVVVALCVVADLAFRDMLVGSLAQPAGVSDATQQERFSVLLGPTGGMPFYIGLFLGPLLLYMLASAVAVGTRQPLKWIILLVAGIATLSGIGQLFRIRSIVHWLDELHGGHFGLFYAVDGGKRHEFIHRLGPESVVGGADAFRGESWIVALLLWFGIAVVLLTLALRRKE